MDTVFDLRQELVQERNVDEIRPGDVARVASEQRVGFETARNILAIKSANDRTSQLLPPAHLMAYGFKEIDRVADKVNANRTSAETDVKKSQTSATVDFPETNEFELVIIPPRVNRTQEQVDDFIYNILTEAGVNVTDPSVLETQPGSSEQVYQEPVTETDKRRTDYNLLRLDLKFGNENGIDHEEFEKRALYRKGQDPRSSGKTGMLDAALAGLEA